MFFNYLLITLKIKLQQVAALYIIFYVFITRFKITLIVQSMFSEPDELKYLIYICLANRYI